MYDFALVVRMDLLYICACIHTHIYTHRQLHKLFQFFSFNIVSDIQFFDTAIEDVSISEGTF